MTYKFQITYDRKLKFSGFISVTERFISAKFQQNLRWSPWEPRKYGVIRFGITLFSVQISFSALFLYLKFSTNPANTGGWNNVDIILFQHQWQWTNTLSMLFWHLVPQSKDYLQLQCYSYKMWLSISLWKKRPKMVVLVSRNVVC